MKEKLPKQVNFENIPKDYFSKSNLIKTSGASAFLHMISNENPVPYRAFNTNPHISSFVSYLYQSNPLNIAIETGTFEGNTTKFLASLFEKVHTIEIFEPKYIEAKKRLNLYDNIDFHLGSSDEVLKKLLPRLKNASILFYLDAHETVLSGAITDTPVHWPLLEELKTIALTHHDNCVIMIDDIQVPKRPDIHFDTYNGEACSFKYVEKSLAKIFTNPTLFYLISPSYSNVNLTKRAKLVALPEKWAKKMELLTPLIN